jgi:hypothetical protein
MSGVKKLKGLSLALIVLFLMNSCAEFFSASWGESFKRDPDNVKVNASNVYDLLDAAKGNPELARAILDKINAGSNDTLKRAAFQAANQAAGISTLALENIRALIDAMDSTDPENALRNVAEKIQADIKSGDLVGIANKMNEILADKFVIPTAAEKPGVALKEMEKIAAFVPIEGSKDKATIIIEVDATGVGTATIITPDGKETSYDCVIDDDGKITLKNSGNADEVTDIKCDINADNTLTLTGLDEIPGVSLESTSKPFVPLGTPEFEENFLDGVSESDLTLMVMALILAKAENEKDDDGLLENYLESWRYKNVKTGQGLDTEEALIAAIVNGMADTSDLTRMIKDLLRMEG